MSKTDLEVVVEIEVGPKTDTPGVILILHHQKLSDAMAKRPPTKIQMYLTPPQADELSELLVRARLKSHPEKTGGTQ